MIEPIYPSISNIKSGDINIKLKSIESLSKNHDIVKKNQSLKKLFRVYSGL